MELKKKHTSISKKKKREKKAATILDDRIPTTRYNPHYKEGLTTQQMQEHRLHGWTNRQIETSSKSEKDIVKENVFTYFNLIFLILSFLLLIVGSFRNLTFLPIIIANTLIGIFQELRSKRVLDKMSMLNAPKALVVRDGQNQVVNAADLVLDDIVIFKAGNQVCADAIVCAGNVQVNESLLTGEADEISKRKGDLLMSGSFIVSGQCHARLDKVGQDSYISKLTMEAKQMQTTEQSEMIRDLNRLVKIVGVMIIPIGLILFFEALFVQGDTFRDSIVSMVAAVLGMIPEGLYLLASVALAVSAMRLANKKVLLHDMKSIETLARVNVLCVDKTGTITENEMVVKDAVPIDDKVEKGRLHTLLSDYAKSMSSDNITMEALKSYFKSTSGRVPESHTGFSSALKYSSVTYEDEVYVLGAPEFVLKEDFAKYREQIQSYAEKGIRVLAFGTYDGVIDSRPLDKPIDPLGLVLLENPIRENAKETFTYFAEQGVDIKVISGDNPVTVSEVALQAGIKNAKKYCDASDLKNEQQMRAALLKNTVFGRVTPEQKRAFVRILKEEGMTVAMTGDGVNDVLALKDADCSIAMASGSEAAANAAQVVLLESDFSRMPEVVLEGRRVVNNIQRSASLFLVKNIFSFLLSIFSAVFFFTYPLEPSQISLISLFTIGTPAFLLALESNKNIIKGRFLTNVILIALPAAITDVLAVGAMVVFGKVFEVPSQDISTAAVFLMAIIGFMILYRVCIPFNKWRAAIFGCMIVCLLFSAYFLNHWFSLTSMSMKCVMLFVVFAIATEPVLRYFTNFTEWLRPKVKQLIESVKTSDVFN